jgi:hypothetical protein
VNSVRRAPDRLRRAGEAHTSSDLDPAAAAKARAACTAAGVIDPVHLDSCTLDAVVLKDNVAIKAFTHRLEPVVAINQTDWSSSIRTGGRHQSVRALHPRHRARDRDKARGAQTIAG